MSPRSWNLLQIHVAVVLFGLAGLFGKLLLFSPVVIVWGRVMFASVVLLLASAVWKLPLWPGRNSLLAFLGLGVLLAVHWTTFFQSVQVSSVAIGLITYSMFPAFVAFLEPLLFREKLSAGDVLLAGITLVGVVVLVPSFDLGNQVTQGVLWGILSGLTFAVLSLLNRKYVRHHSSITIALYQDVCAALALLPFAVHEWPVFTVTDLLLLLLLGMFCTATAHSLFIAGMHGIRARTASMIASLEPVYGIVFAGLFLAEVPTLRTLLGGLIILGAAFYATIHAGAGAISEKEAPAT